MEWTEQDLIGFEKAFKEAEKAQEKGNIPIGASLFIDKKLIGVAGNSQETDYNHTSHAETNLLIKHSSEIRKAKKERKEITLYSTLEPCLMCFGMIMQTKVTNLYFSCPDSFGGATNLTPPTKWYSERMPKIKSGYKKEESLNMIINYMKDKPKWGKVIKSWEVMKKSFSQLS